MKKLLALLPLLLILTSCQSANLEANFSSAKKEATEAVDNLTNEAVGIKEGVETKINQIQEAADAVSDATGAINEAKDSVQTVITGEKEE